MQAEVEARRDWMGLLAQAPAEDVRQLWAATGQAPAHDTLRAPEIGAVMVRGRVGGTGTPFNLGEATVTRCTVQLACGTVGHAWVQGRDREKARIAALCDALMQTDAAPDLQARLLDPLRARVTARATDRAEAAAATRVEFFTLVRGED